MSELIFKCPRCPETKSPKLYINVEKEVFNCFRCGFKGPLFLLSQYPEIYDKLDISQSVHAYSKLKEYFLIPEHAHLDIFKELAPVRPISESDQQYLYLKSRGWTEEMIFNYSPLVSTVTRFNNRVIIPIIENDNIIYFTARALDDTTSLKYLNAKVSKTNIMFKSNLHCSVINPDDLIICEGIFDAAKIPNAIALLGKILPKESEKTLLNMAKNKKHIYVSLDSGAENEILTLASTLTSWFPNKSIYTINTKAYEHKDLGKLSENLSSLELLSFIKTNSQLYKIPSLSDSLKSKFQTLLL